MIYKYARNITGQSYGPGRRSDPSKWIMGEDPFTREKYYAWLKHRSQAAFRKEEYSLTWDDWQALWSDEDFLNRGRGMDNVCLFQIEHGDGWHLNNVAVEIRCTSKSFNGKRPANGQ